MEEAMDIKHTEFTASSKKIEISNDSGSVNIVRENVQVNIVNSKSAAEPPVDEMLSEEVFLTEAALVEPVPEKPIEEAQEEPAAEDEEDSDAGTFRAYFGRDDRRRAHRQDAPRRSARGRRDLP